MQKNTFPLLVAGIAIVGLGGVFAVYSMNSSKSEMVVDQAVMEEGGDTMVDDQTEMMAEGYMDVTPAEAMMMIDQNPDLIIIDVSPKYDEGHIPGAINFYVGDGSLDEAIPTLDPMAEYLVYCHVDSASIQGAQKLVEAGFEKVYRLEGNYAAWVDAGYEVE